MCLDVVADVCAALPYVDMCKEVVRHTTPCSDVHDQPPNISTSACMMYHRVFAHLGTWCPHHTDDADRAGGVCGGEAHQPGPG